MPELKPLLSLISAFPYWEAVAVTLAIAYLLLAMKENIWCWYCALFSTLIYTVLFWNVSLVMESALNLYYLIMAVYGWQQWRNGGDKTQALQITRWPIKNHLIAVLTIITASLTSGYLLQQNTHAALPYLDSFTTWASVITTYMVAKKILENWLYWILIDSLSMYLYLERGLTLTALLFAAYVVIACFGVFLWKKLYLSEPPPTQPGAQLA